MRSEIRLNRALLLVILSHQCDMMNRSNMAFMFAIFAIIELGLAAFAGIKENK